MPPRACGRTAGAGIFFILAFAFFPGTAFAAKPHAEASLLTDKSALKPGEPFKAAVFLKMEKGWHTYWSNPGEAGLATQVLWKLPEGFEAGPVQWPYPVRFENGGIVNYGYTGAVMLISEIRVPPAQAEGGSVTVAASVSWLACNQVCVPEKAEVSAVLPVKNAAAKAGPKTAARFAAARRRIPRPLTRWEIFGETQEKKIVLRLRPLEGLPDPVEGAFFFPEDKEVVEYADPQTYKETGRKGGFELSLPVSSYAKETPARLRGVLVVKNKAASILSTKRWATSYEIDIPLEKI